MKLTDITRLQTYLQAKFENDAIKLVQRPKAADSVEMTVDGDFLGVVYRDEEDGEVSFSLSICVLEEDLPNI